MSDLKKSLEFADKNCGHLWGEAIYCPEYTKGYYVEGDPPGTMGVDWRGGYDVPSKTIERWKRVCKKCGKEEFTTNKTEQVKYVPRF